MDETPPPIPQPTPTPVPITSHSHTTLWILGVITLIVAVFIGGYFYLGLKDASTEVSQSPNTITASQDSSSRIQLMTTEDNSPSLYYKEGSVIYYGDYVISEADPETFIALSIKAAAGGNDNDWAKDKNHVYDAGRIVAEADPSTFITVYRGVMKDRNFVYLYGGTSANPESPIYGADPATFISIGFWFFKDKNYAYNLDIGEKLEDIDPLTVVVLNYRYVKDKNGVYAYRPERLEKSPTYKMAVADQKTFQVFEGEYAEGFGKDQDHVYAFGEIIEGADPLSFQILPPVNSHLMYMKDGSAVYAYSNDRYSKIGAADPVSFVLVEGQATYDAQDKNHTYFQGEVAE